MSKKQYWIKCKQVVEYHHTIELTDEEFSKLEQVYGDDVSERSDPEEFAILQGAIDHSEVCDSENEYLSVEVYKDKGK